MNRLVTTVSAFDWPLIAVVIAGVLLIAAYVIGKAGLSRLSDLLDIVAAVAVFVAGLLLFGDRALGLILSPTECNFDLLLCTVDRLFALLLATLSVVVLATAVARIRSLRLKK